MQKLDLAEGRRLLAALTPGPYDIDHEEVGFFGYDIAPLPMGMKYGMHRIEDARAVLWLLQHHEQLLALAAQAQAAMQPALPIEGDRTR